jgi:hypothetical protein
MNLWSILGVSPQVGIVGASLGALAAFVLGVATIRRRSRGRPSSTLELFDR